MDISTYFLEEDLINNTINAPSTLPLHINEMHNLSDCSYNYVPDLTEIDVGNLTNDTWMGYNIPSSQITDQEVLATPQLTPDSCVSTVQTTLDEFEEFLAPLLSPAIAPSFSETFELHNSTNDQSFTSLSSPVLALGPKSENSNVLASSLVLDESSSPNWNGQSVVSPITVLCRTTALPPQKLSLRQQAVLQKHDPNLPATPASLMNMDTKSHIQHHHTIKSARKKSKLLPTKIVPLKPLISPYRQPNHHQTSSMPKNNNIRDTTEGSISLSGLEGRRSAHKVAEQRRRDVLKKSFDSLRNEITDILIVDCMNEPLSEKEIREEKEKEVKNMSKVLLLQHSYDYILRLKRDVQEKDQRLEKMQLEIKELRSRMTS